MTRDRFIVDVSPSGRNLLTYRQWDDDKGRLAVTKTKVALSRLLTDLGAEPGDEVEVSVRIVRKAAGGSR